jgi:hypothetical protein
MAKEKDTVTFRVNMNILDNFKVKCEDEGVEMSAIIESFMWQYAHAVPILVKPEEEYGNTQK